jgi:hypothetical protein
MAEGAAFATALNDYPWNWTKPLPHLSTTVWMLCQSHAVMHPGRHALVHDGELLLACTVTTTSST